MTSVRGRMVTRVNQLLDSLTSRKFDSKTSGQAVKESRIMAADKSPDTELEPRVRRAVPDDAAAITAVLRVVVDERVHSAIDRAWSIEQERRYLESLSTRAAVHVAVDHTDHVVGVQILDRWSAELDATAHVGQLGT